MVLKAGNWQDEIDVRDFINRNYTPYDGDQSFLEEATEATTKLNDMLIDIKLKERVAGGVLDADTKSCFDDHFTQTRLFR